MKSERSVFLGESEHACLTLRVLGRERPDALDADDRNWLQAAVEVSSGSMVGVVTCSLRAEDIADFRRSLSRLSVETTEAAKLSTMEGRLGLRVDRDALQLGVSGHIADGIAGNRLSFRFGVATARLPAVLAEIDDVLEDFLVR